MNHRYVKIFQQVIFWPVYLLLKFFVHYKIEGQENLEGLEKKGIIFASNHASYFDGPISATSLPRTFFPVRFLVANIYCHISKNPIPFPLSLLAVSFIKLNGCIPVKNGISRSAVNGAIKVLKENGKLWIYPEGKMTKNGLLQQGNWGVVYLHFQTKVPVVPVGIVGNYKILSLKTLLRGNKVTIKIGRPLCLMRQITYKRNIEIVMKEIKSLLA